MPQPLIKSQLLATGQINRNFFMSSAPFMVKRILLK